MEQNSTDWWQISRDAYDLFRKLAAQAEAASPDAAAILMQHARDAESIGVRAWAHAVKENARLLAGSAGAVTATQERIVT